MTISNRDKRDLLYSLQENLIKERDDGNIFEEINSLIKIGDILINSNNFYENKLFYNIIFKNRLPIFDFTCKGSTACCTTFNVNIFSSDLHRISTKTKKNYFEFCQVSEIFFDLYSKGKITKKDILNEKYSLFIEMIYKENSKICIFLENSLCSINSFKPQTCTNFPLVTTKGKISYTHSKFLEKRCNYILKDNNTNINKYIKNIFFHSYLFNMDCFIVLKLIRETKKTKTILNKNQIIEFFVSEYLNIKNILNTINSKINKKNIDYILVSYDLNNEKIIFEIITNDNIINDLKKDLKNLNIRKYKDKLFLKFNNLNLEIIFKNKLPKVFGKDILYSKEEYFYHTEKNILDTITIDVAYKTADNLYNLIYFSVKNKDINSIIQYLSDFKLLNDKFQDEKINTKFIKSIKKVYLDLNFEKFSLKNELLNYINNYGNSNYYIEIIKIHLEYIENNNIILLENNISYLISNFKEKELKIYKYLIKNKLDIYPINKLIYNNLKSLINKNTNIEEVFNLIDTLNKDRLEINIIDILFDKLDYYLSLEKYEISNKIIYEIKKLNNSFDNLIKIADVYLSNNLLDLAFLEIQECLKLTEDKNFLEELSLNIIIDYYFNSEKQVNLFYYMLNENNRKYFDEILKNKFENNILTSYINYKINKNLEVLNKLKFKYFNIDKKKYFFEIIKLLAENLSFQYVLENNINIENLFIQNSNYQELNSLIVLSKGDFNYNHKKLHELINLYKIEKFDLLDDIVLKI